MALGFDRFHITVNGAPITSPLADDVIRMVVDTNLHMPGMFEIHIAENSAPLGMYKWIDSPMFAIGGKVKIAASPQPANNLPPAPAMPQPLISGEITAVEAHFNEGGSAVLVVRGYDPSHRLHRGRKTQTYLMMTDSAIIQQISAAAGLVAQVTPTTVVHEYVLRNNLTDMEFIRQRASRLGYDVSVNDMGALVVGKSGVPQGPPVTLTWNKDLSSFSPRVTAANQVGQVSVQGWDPKAKMGINGMFGVLPNTEGGVALTLDKTTARTVFGAAAKDVTVDQPVANMGEAVAVAQGIAGRIQDAIVQADGVCLGNPGVTAGVPVVIVGVGAKFSGQYLVTSATHVYDESGYTTTFHVDGREPGALLALLNGHDHEPDVGRASGVVIGVVTNNNDTLGLGRVKVRFPHLGSAPPVESNWCRVASPMAGPLRGFYAIPEVNDEVLVAFEHGDVNYPYVIGSLWNNVDRPPKPSSAVVVGGKVTQRIFKSPVGHQIILDDTPGAEKITIVDKTMTNSIEIDSKPPGAIKLTVNGDCIVDAKGKVQIKSAAQDVEVNCLNFKVTANANIQMKANAQMQLEGTAMVNMKNGAGAQVAMSGPTVNVNNGALEVM